MDSKVEQAILDAYSRGKQEQAQAVADLWHRNNAWIPAAARSDLEAVLGVDLDPPNGPRCNRMRNVPIG